MSDLDKDIEIVKGLGLEYYVVNKKRTKITFKESLAIERVLEELEKEKQQRIKATEYLIKFIKNADREIKNGNDFNNFLNKKLETKDKIIDLMARQINNYDAQLVINKFRSKEDVLDWARNEVENDKQS